MERLVRFAALLCCLTACRATAQTPDPKPPRPNFLFVYLDDLRWDGMGFYQQLQGEKARFPWLRTPNIDRLAAQGTWCRNTFATDSLCSPSRASFLTGQYPHVHGVVNNHQPLPPASVTYATLLRAAGYYTGFIGKWHMGQQAERPGFDYSASFLGQGEYYHCPFLIDGKPAAPSDKWVDDLSTDYAVDFLKQHKDRPFVLAVAFKSVHAPLEPNGPDQGLYPSETARPVPSLEVPASFQLPYHPKPYPRDLPTLLPYFQCLAGADRDLGRLLDTLDALKLTQNTMVIFASDNGFALGEHELRGKRDAYEESMRIPFLVRAPFIPGTAGKVVDQTVLNIDVAPTMLDYAGVPIPEAMQGRSIRPLLEGKTPRVAGWDRAFLYEHFFQKNVLMPTIIGLRTDDAKLVTYPAHPGWTELFRFANDPYEIANLAGKPEALDLQHHLEAELARLRDVLAYVVPGDSDRDTYAADAERDVQWRLNSPGRPMSTHSHFAPKEDRD